MRIIIVIFLILVIVVGTVGAFPAMQGDGANPYADDCSSASEKITTPENCSGAPDGEFVEIAKGGPDHSLLLDMGDGQEGTGDLIMYYKTEKNLNILVEFNIYSENKIIPLEQHTVELIAGKTTVLVPYDNSPTPYRYVRFYASEERKYKLDAVKAETHWPDSDQDGLTDHWELTYGLNPLVATGNDGPNNDNDSDMLTNKEEFEHGINPNHSDTDGDGLPDEWELDHKLKPDSNEGKNGADGNPDDDGLNNLQEYTVGTHPNKEDTDKDKLSDGDEILLYGTNPNDEDSDGDGMFDGWEVNSGLAALIPDNQDGDPDQDGLTNILEFKAGSNANHPDTDQDGSGDLTEVNGDTDPTNWEDGDLDGDGLTNGDEKTNFGTDPNKKDTDDDGLPDLWEIANGLKGTDSTGLNGAEGDPDNDGVTNIWEYAKGSNPNQPDTDQDGLPDSWEILHCLYPYDDKGDHGPDGDPDQDGKTNFVEMGMESPPTIGCVP